MIEIIPAIIPQNINHIKEQLKKIAGLVKKVQIDVVDGKYAPVQTWPFKADQRDELMMICRGEITFPNTLGIDLEIDMLILHPIEYVCDFLSLGAKSFVFHLDSTDHLEECIETVKNCSCKVGIGVKPNGNMILLESFLPKIDFVQFMGNNKLGYNGVELDKNVLIKIKDFHDRHPSVPIQIDIGVNSDTIPLLKEAGVSRFVSGSSIFNTSNPKEAIKHLQNL